MELQHEVARGASIQVASFIDNVELQLGTVLEDIGVAHPTRTTTSTLICLDC